MKVIHTFPREKFPITITLYSRLGIELWSKVIDEPAGLTAVAIPGYAGTQHVPVRVVIEYADGTIESL